jgi:hypothetical protein
MYIYIYIYIYIYSYICREWEDAVQNAKAQAQEATRYGDLAVNSRECFM